MIASDLGGLLDTAKKVVNKFIDHGVIVSTHADRPTVNPPTVMTADPDDFVPQRYAESRQEDLVNRWTWIPFGAGRHRCVGANFAMIQLKAIFSVLLRDWAFELGQPPDSYRNDHSKMVVQLARPCVVRYRRRQGTGAAG